MLICDLLHTMVNNKLYENNATVKLAPRTSCLFDLLDVQKNHRRHQAYRKTMSVGNEKTYTAHHQFSHYIPKYIYSLDCFCQLTAKELLKLKL